MDSERISDAALAQAFRELAEAGGTFAQVYAAIERRARELSALEQREAATLNELSGNSGQLATPPRDVPDGFVLVPRVPTEAMIRATNRVCYPEDAEEIYAAMLAAAPSGEGKK